MSSERLLELIGEADDRYIADAARPKSRAWVGWVAMAASLAVLVGGVAWAIGTETTLPKLTIYEQAGEGMGMEAHVLSDPAEWLTGNPWTEDAGLKTLPVYRSLITRDEGGYVIENRSRLDAAAFKQEIETRLGALAEQATVELDASSYGTCAVITFSPGVPLPEEYRFRYYASYDETLAVAEYLRDTYRTLIGMEDPVISITGGEYTYNKEQGYDIYFYENSDDLTTRMQNFHFGYVRFACNDAGELWMIRIAEPELTDNKMGDYPLISVDEATEQLISGNYISTVPEEYLGETQTVTAERIASVELKYRIGYWDEYLIPYYRFLVRLDRISIDEELDMDSYGAFYVPAIEPAYIGDVVLWDGTFNK